MTGPSPAAVTRWRKYGHDRLYVTAADGTRLGYLDLKTGQETLDAPARVEEFHAALAAHQASPVSTQGPERPAAAAVPVPQPIEPAWRDLALNRPGQGVREKADEHLDAMKSRSRLLTAAARVLDVKTDERAWRKGADGEESMGARLEKLTDRGWRVLHSVPVNARGTDIDHILIGPGGVYTINTKNHPGKKIWVSPTQIRVGGYPVRYLDASRHEADRARRVLSAAVGWDVPVKPVLILLTGTLIPDVTIKSGGPADVLILDRMDVPGAFKKAPTRLQPEHVAALFDVARRSTTWTS